MQRSTVNITTQLGVETTQGTPVAANRIIRSLSFMPKFRRETGGFTPRGHRYPTIQMVRKEHGEGNYEGIACYNGLLYIIASMIQLPTVAAIGAAPTAKKWTLAPSTTGVETGKSYTFEVGDATKVDKFPGGVITSFTGDFGQDDIRVNGDLVALKPTFNATQTASPTSIPARPILRNHLDVYLDTTFGGIGTTKITDVMNEQLSFGRKKHPVWAHNTARPSWSDLVDVPVDFTYSFTTPHNSQSRTYLDSLTGRQYFRILATGPQIDTDGVTPVYESMKLDIAGEFDEPQEVDEDDAYAFRYTFRSLHDDAMGGAWKMELINLLSAL